MKIDFLRQFWLHNCRICRFKKKVAIEMTQTQPPFDWGIWSAICKPWRIACIMLHIILRLRLETPQFSWLTNRGKSLPCTYSSTKLLKEDLTKMDEVRQRAGHKEKQSIGAAGRSTSAEESATKMRNLMFPFWIKKDVVVCRYHLQG